MKLGVLVLSWNAPTVLLACLRSIAAQQRPVDRLLVVDNASSEDVVGLIAATCPAVPVLRTARNLGFAGGMNTGIRAMFDQPDPPDVIALVNQDAELDTGWSAAILAPFADRRVGAVGCKILYPDGTLQHAGKYLEWPRAVAQHIGWHTPDHGQYDTPRAMPDLTAAAIALRADALRDVGLFDPGYAPAYYEDSDLCWRLRQAGWTLWYAPAARLTHHESLSIRDPLRRSQLYNRGRLRFVLKNYPFAAIVGPFADAEREFVARHGVGAEARALRWAYLATLAELPAILQARARHGTALSATEARAVEELLRDCKQHLARALHRRAMTVLNRLV